VTEPQRTEPHRDEQQDDGAPHPFGLFPVVVLLVVIASGIFLVFELRDISTIQDCVWSGRKNCAPVDVGR
jgi:hypothetical protein